MRLKSSLLATVIGSAIALGSGVANATEITTLPGPTSTEQVFGVGSSLIAPYFRQAADCYSIKTPLIFTGTPPTTQTLADFTYTGEPSQHCATTDYVTNRKITYMSTGSGVGIGALYSHDPAKAGDSDPAAGNQFLPKINFALSETALGAADVAIYNNGGTEQGIVTKAAGVTPGAGEYPNAAYNYGALIQFPVLVTAVAIAYDPVYKKVRAADGSITEYEFRNRWERADSSGGLRLSQQLVCAIFNGDVTNWNNADLKTLNKSSALKSLDDGAATFNVPMQIVGREDSSGTSSLWTRFLANACSSYAGNSYGNSTSRMPGTYTDSTGGARTTATLNKDLAGAVWNKSSDNFGAGAVFYSTGVNDAETLGKYTLANGSDGVAKYIDFTQEPSATIGDSVQQGRIGYVGPDFVLPGVLVTLANTYNLKTFDVANALGQFRAPTPANALSSYKSAVLPESDASGNFVAAASCSTATPTVKCRKNPQDWVEPADKSSVLANTNNSGASYPIMGTTNALMYSCYAKALSSRTLISFWGNFYESQKTITDVTLGLLAQASLAPVPSNWRKAIKTTFFDTTDPTGLGLTVGTVGVDAKCAAGDFGARIGG
jgi:phosphate transport system substrate-binding protein